MSRKYNELQGEYNELLRKFKVKEDEAEKYKRLYQDEINRER